MKKYASNLLKSSNELIQQPKVLEMLKEGLGYQTKPKITMTREEAEQELLKNGWEKFENPCGTIFIDMKSHERGDAYALLQRKALGL